MFSSNRNKVYAANDGPEDNDDRQSRGSSRTSGTNMSELDVSQSTEDVFGFIAAFRVQIPWYATNFLMFLFQGLSVLLVLQRM